MLNPFEHPNVPKTIVAILGGLAGLLGGYDLLLQVLLIAISLDIVVGSARAFLACEVSAAIAFRGGFRKLGVLVAVALATLLDQVVAPAVGAQLLRTAAAAYYIAVEGVSIMGHLAALGVPLPPVLVDALSVYQSKKNEDKGNSGVTAVRDGILPTPAPKKE